MIVNRSIVFLIAACVCFIAALLIAIHTITGNEQAWVAGGLLALALSFLP